MATAACVHRQPVHPSRRPAGAYTRHTFVMPSFDVPKRRVTPLSLKEDKDESHEKRRPARHSAALALLQSYVPILEWLPAYDRAHLISDCMAGLTVASMIIPQAITYANVAALPASMGLISAMVPMFVYALLGPCRHSVQMMLGRQHEPCPSLSQARAASCRSVPPRSSR